MLTREQLSRNLGTNLERERFKLGYSQQDMAKALDMSLSSYKRLANGDTGKVDVKIQIRDSYYYDIISSASLPERCSMNYVANPLIYSRPMTACAIFRLHSYILLNPLYSLNSILPEIWKRFHRFPARTIPL